MKYLLPFLLVITFLASCEVDDNNLSCSAGDNVSVLNVQFYAKDSSTLTSLTIDSVWVTADGFPDTLLTARSVSEASVRLVPNTSSTLLLFRLDSSTAPLDSLTLNYTHSTEFISQDCGYANKFDLSNATGSDSVAITNTEVSVFNNGKEHIRIFR